MAIWNYAAMVMSENAQRDAAAGAEIIDAEFEVVENARGMLPAPARDDEKLG